MKSKMWLGLLFIAVGIVVALDQVGVLAQIGIDKSLLFQVLGVLAGLVLIFILRSTIFGSILLFLALTSLVKNWYDIGSLVFPGILVIIGIELLLGGFRGKKPLPLDSNHRVDAFAIFGGIERKVISNDFKGGQILALFGAVELDLTQVTLTSDAYLEINAILGGIELRIPPNLQLRNEVQAFMGGVENKFGENHNQGGPVLILRGSAILGEIEIK